MYEDDRLHLAPRFTQYRTWLPQQGEGANLDASTQDLAIGDFIPGSGQSRKGAHNAYIYHFNGHEVIPHPATTIDPALGFHQAVSVYHEGSVIYHVNYNASEHAVGEANVSSLDHIFMNWEEIGFHHLEDGSSRIDTNALPRLQMTRGGHCRWPRRLLPNRYHPENINLQSIPNVVPPIGSLGGKLALLIALVALSASPEDVNAVHNTLVDTIRASNWQLPNQHGLHPGCMFPTSSPNSCCLLTCSGVNRRGLIVNVYTTLADDGTDNEDQLATWEHLGVMFP
jgi:hypothetical protein